ncbi:MAG TPA: pectinesterase family protein [Thermoanaerobaculia bacterium]
MRRAAALALAGVAAAAWAAAPPAAKARREAGVDLVVASDGSGDFRTIQAALDALPARADRMRVVFVKRGTYREKVFLTKSRVALVGEDRSATEIVFPELRSCWRETHPDDWGAAVVNVGDGVTDLVLANLTARNTAGRLTGSDDHQFVVRSGAGTTRIATLSADFVSDGGDTLSLWNSEDGQYFHADCFFEGHVDLFCPRGDAWVADSRFFCRSRTAALWHDGGKDPSHRLVVDHCSFDGVPGFALGRFTRDGQIYLLDARFSAAMADRPIFLAREPTTFAFGLRVFYSGCRAAGGEKPWSKDNLADAPGAPEAARIDPLWTFRGTWDPENDLPPVLPFASLPRPRDGRGGVPPGGATLVFAPARGATSHRVFFGRSAPPPAAGEASGNAFATGPLEPGATYYWRVDAVTEGGTVPGPLWSFRTAAAGRNGVGRT